VPALFYFPFHHPPLAMMIYFFFRLFFALKSRRPNLPPPPASFWRIQILGSFRLHCSLSEFFVPFPIPPPLLLWNPVFFSSRVFVTLGRVLNFVFTNLSSFRSPIADKVFGRAVDSLYLFSYLVCTWSRLSFLYPFALPGFSHTRHSEFLTTVYRLPVGAFHSP